MKEILSVVAIVGISLSATGRDGIAYAEPEPVHMEAALDALRAAERQLEKSSPDDAGHRTRALGLTKDAIDQLEKAVDRRR